ncbi:MAG TPA: hypothetical protein VF761_14965 [Gemmatimonadaceae bacterium]
MLATAVQLHELSSGEAPDARASVARPTRRRARIFALVLSTLVVAGAFRSAPPVEAAAGLPSAATLGESLRLPVAYLATSPASELLDALTLLTPGQHGAIFVWILGIFIVWRVVRWRRFSLGREAAAFVVFLVAYAGVYAVGLLAPRPMAAIAVSDGDALAVDVHSHTSASHDGRRGFDAEDNRRWHAAAGFAAAYVTDHVDFTGVEAGMSRNPARAGQGTVLLPGIESALPGAHVMVLGARRETGIDRQGTLDLARLRASPGLVVVLAFPARLASVPSRIVLNAVEGSDGAPRGLRFTRMHVVQIRAFAAAHGLARVAGSNNHGWGRTAAAWTVLRIPGWRGMSAVTLDSAIRATIRRGAGVRVVLRAAVAPPASNAAWIATPLLVAWEILRRLSPAERLVWLAWIWVPLALPALRRRREAPNASASAAPAPPSPARGRSARPRRTSAPRDRCAAP